MQCASCSCWIIASFFYHELLEKWDQVIDGPITPGYRKRYEREGERKSIPADEVQLSFKYCTRGRLKRFYILKHPRDTKPPRQVLDCPDYTTGRGGQAIFPVPSPLWSLCTQEAHGPSRVKGHFFYPGLYENSCYCRLPAHNNIRPQLIEEGCCDVCGRGFSRGILVQEVTRFCCNSHYLQWWRDRNPEVYATLNRKQR